ncbi:unnamed protein product [Auanema sp. JU1783]|nr:unnamed protein product [Auanema sp. JU1783]
MVEPWQDHSSNLQQFKFDASSLPTKNVIVYCDRAEVKRLVVANLNKGTNEIIIQNVSAVIERQSVRVDGRGALIQEVQYQEMPIDTKTENEKVRGLEEEKLKLENERFTVEDEITSLKKRIDVLDGVAAQIAAGAASAAPSGVPSGPEMVSCGSQPNLLARRHTITGPSNIGGGGLLGNSPIGFLMNEDALGNLEKFLNYYGNTTGDMKAELRKKQRESDQITEQIDILERQIDQLRCGYEYDSIKRYFAF